MDRFTLRSEIINLVFRKKEIRHGDNPAEEEFQEIAENLKEIGYPTITGEYAYLMI